MSDLQAPPWFQQVLEEHRELHRTVAGIREFLQLPRPEPGETGAHAWAARLSKSLVAFHDELFRHFRFEDEGGMAEDIARRHPRAAAAAEQLSNEHTEILSEVRLLMNETLTYSQAGSSTELSLRRRVTAVLDRLGQHERSEIDMIQSLETDDLGIGD